MSTQQLKPDKVIGDQRTDVDLKKTDYTLENWDQTNELVEHIESYHPEAQRIIQTIEDQQNGIRPVMHMLGRTDTGTRVHLRVHGVEPYLYVPHNEYTGEIKDDEKVVRVEKGHENIQGEHVVKVFTRIPGDVPKVRDGYTHYEADILFPNRYLIDSGIEGAVSIPTEHATPEPTDVTVEDLKPTETDTKTRVCFCDIEVDDEGGFPNEERAEREVTAITVYDNYIQDYIVYLYHPELPDVTHEEATVKIYDDEERMLRAFAEYIIDRDFDAITGWNFQDFDARYLVNRLDTLKDQNSDPLVTKSDLSTLGSAYDDGYFGAKIKGMAVVDMLDGYENLQFSELDSYSLEDVAQEELGTGKITDNRDLYELWENDPQKLVDYNFKDVELTVMLEKKQGIIKFYEEIANYVGGRLAEVVDASKAVDIKVLRAVNGEWAVPSAGNVETEEFEGAKVFDPITGVKKNVAVLDLKSLYPMSMKTINAGPETKDPEGELIAPNGIRFNNEEDAVVVEIIDEMLEERQKYKDLRDEHPPDSDEYANYDRKQSAIKVVMNCFSGDTNVMTPNGVKNIKNFDEGDEVYSINPETGDIEVKSVTNTVKQKNQYGKLEHIQTNNTDLKITPNHRMVTDSESIIEVNHFNDLPKGVNHTIPVHESIDGEIIQDRSIIDEANGKFWVDIGVHGNSFRNICPDEIYMNMFYSKNRTSYLVEDIDVLKSLIEWNESRSNLGASVIDDIGVQYDDKHSTIPVSYNMNDWLELLGWVISEGSFNSVEEKDDGSVSYRGKSDRVQISQKQTDYRTEITQLVDRMGLNYSTDSNGVYLYNSNMYNILKSSVGSDSYDKRIPDWVFEYDMDSSQLEHLLFALIGGDGDETGAKSYRYSTKSEELKDDVMQLAVLCGYKVSYNESGGMFRVYINQNKGSFQKGEGGNVESESHNDYVYCIEVEDNHTLMAGRNGKYQWTGNTLYGVMGWDRFRLQDKDVGAAVTAVGREVIKFTEEVVEEMGYHSVYGDTDSVMIQIDEIDKSTIEDEKNVQRVLDDHDVDSIHEFKEQVEERRGEMDEAEFNKYFAVLVIGYEMEERINDRYDEFAKRELNADEHFFQIEFEKLYRTFFQAGKKKRYAGNITWKEGKVKDSIDIVGFEYKRSDYSKTAKQLMKRVFNHILREGTLDDISEDVNNVIDKLKNLEYDPDDFGIPASVTQDFDDYDAKTMAVRGSEYANEYFDAGIQPGDKPKLNYVKRILPSDDGKIEYPLPDPSKEKEQPCCWMNFQDIPDVVQWDWEKYVDAQIKGPLKRILSGTDWTWGEVISGQKRHRLGEYNHEDEASDVDSGPLKMKKETPTDDDLDDFDTEPSDSSNSDSMEAKKQLSQAQAMLEGYDDEDQEDDEPVEMNSIELDDGPSTIHDFM